LRDTRCPAAICDRKGDLVGSKGTRNHPERQVLATRNRDPSPSPRPPPRTPLLPSPPREGRREAPVGTPQFPSPLGGRAGQRRRGPRSILRIAATLRIAGRATRGMPRAPDPGARNESARRGRSCGPIGRNGADYGDRPLTPPFLAASPLQPTRAPLLHILYMSRAGRMQSPSHR